MWNTNRGNDLKWRASDAQVKPALKGTEFWVNRSYKDVKAPALVISKPTKKPVTVIGRKPKAKRPTAKRPLKNGCVTCGSCAAPPEN